MSSTHPMSFRANAGRCVTVLGILLVLSIAVAVQAAPGECLSEAEATLAELINEYREENSLDPIPVTTSLTEVAQWHVWDLSVNSPHGGECNLHSWSDGELWTPVCYTPDHANASGMWLKPGEITGDVYTGYGYEIAFSGSSDPAIALNAWKQSAGHNDVILNAGIWNGFDPWPAMGIGMQGGFAVVWFGDLADPQGTIAPCSATSAAKSSWGALKALYTGDES